MIDNSIKPGSFGSFESSESFLKDRYDPKNTLVSTWSFESFESFVVDAVHCLHHASLI